MLLSASLTAAPDPGAAEEALDRFFDREHYATLAIEGEQFAEYPDAGQMPYIRALAMMTVEKRAELDGYIGTYAHGWTARRLSRTAGAILRCAMCEILYLPDVPDAAAINEAVELAKKYEGEEGPAFINGVLGGFVRGVRGAEGCAGT